MLLRLENPKMRTCVLQCTQYIYVTLIPWAIQVFKHTKDSTALHNNISPWWSKFSLIHVVYIIPAIIISTRNITMGSIIPCLFCFPPFKVVPLGRDISYACLHTRTIIIGSIIQCFFCIPPFKVVPQEWGISYACGQVLHNITKLTKPFEILKVC